MSSTYIVAHITKTICYFIVSGVFYHIINDFGMECIHYLYY